MLESSVVRTGLYTAAASPVRLSGVSIEAEVSNFSARVMVTQRYQNRERTPIEAVYLFPPEEESPSHPVAMTIDACAAEVTLASRDATLDRDFVLAVHAGGLTARIAHPPRVTTASSHDVEYCTGDRLTEYAIRTFVTRDVVRCDRTSEDAGSWGRSTAPRTDCLDERMGRL